MTDQSSEAIGNPKETTWIDAWIRWERDSKDVIDDDEEDGAEEEIVPPTETYSFTYNLPEGGRFRRNEITLKLKGFPMESEQIWNSTGLTLWPCSHYLCEYLVDNVSAPLFSNKQQILEVGSGLGRCGLLKHALVQALTSTSDDYHVWLTDGDTDTLKQLRANVNLNVTGNCETTISCHQLLWGTESAKNFSQRYFSKPSQCVDLIIGSDLIYVPSVIEPLFDTAKTLLQPSGLFLMAHSNRREGSSVTLEMVLEGAEKAMFRYDIVKEVEEEGIFIIQFRLLDESPSDVNRDEL